MTGDSPTPSLTEQDVMLITNDGKVFASFALRSGLRDIFLPMDATDREILAVLQNEGRISLTDLAGRVHLSVSRCQRRVRDLEATGTIRGYRAIVDAEQLGFGFEVLGFATLEHAYDVSVFDDAVGGIPEVVEAQRLFGEPDYLLRIVTADLRAYQRLYDGVLTRLPGLRGLNSTIVMKETVPRRPLPASGSRGSAPSGG